MPGANQSNLGSSGVGFGHQSGRSLSIALACLMLISCQTATDLGKSLTIGDSASLPKYSPKANTLLYLSSNKTSTEFFLNGKLLVRGKRAKVLIDPSLEYVVLAKNSEFGEKEAFIQPPHRDGGKVEFFYMLGDRIAERGHISDSSTGDPPTIQDAMLAKGLLPGSRNFVAESLTRNSMFDNNTLRGVA